MFLFMRAIFPENDREEKDVKQFCACNVSGNSAERWRATISLRAPQGHGLDARVNPNVLPAIFHASDYFVARYFAEIPQGFAAVKGRHDQN